MNKHLKTIGDTLNKNSPTILTGCAVAGLMGTTVMAVSATPEALRLIMCEENLRAKEGTSLSLTKVEIIKLTWKCYIPTVLMGGATIACVIGANAIGLKRNAALASLYSLTEKSLKEYQGKVIETIGEKKEQKIQDEIAKDHLLKNPPRSDEIISTGNGETLCYDSLSGRYFKSDIEKIRKAENLLNKDLLADNFISLNEIYEELGLPPIGLGDEVGWALWIDDGDDLVSFAYSSQLTADGIPCLVLNYAVKPKFDYLDTH